MVRLNQKYSSIGSYITKKVETNIIPTVGNLKAKSTKEDHLIVLKSIDIIGVANNRSVKNALRNNIPYLFPLLRVIYQLFVAMTFSFYTVGCIIL
jgi:hypothetical protein